MLSRASAVSPEKFTDFGDLLKYLRRRAGLTQRELSIAVGYSDTQISRMEQNQRVPDQATLTARFVSALQIANEPEMVARLSELARAARQEAGPPEGPRASPLPQHNLPVQLTSFVGRERQIAEVKRWLSVSRLVTLTGTGGCGKTRLALQVAAELVAEYPDGVWLIELASLSDPALVTRRLATTLSVHEQPGRALITTLTDYLRAKQILLMFDNCEHLVEACAQLAEALLQACPGLRILATGREALEVTGEAPFYVPSLSLPALAPRPGPPVGPDLVSALMQSEAGRLFVERAARPLPTFTLTEQNAPAVVQVCRRLHGIPLAIELAAARVKLLRVEQIAARLDDRFGLLTARRRTALPRYQTLQASIDWSYDLPSESERALLRRLSVFASGWTVEAAEAVCADEGEGSRKARVHRQRFFLPLS